MAHWIVLQPNRRLARFSSITDDFTHMNMTQAQAFEVLSETMPMEDALVRISSGYRDIPAKGSAHGPYGTRRWNHAINRIKMVHGEAAFLEAYEIGTTDPGEDYIVFDVFKIDEEADIKQDFSTILKMLCRISEENEGILYPDDVNNIQEVYQSYAKKYPWLKSLNI